MNFIDFKQAVAVQFGRMSDYPMFRVAVSKDALWDTYLGSFPEGTNPLYRQRTEHDCNCCKQFIRAIGGAVAIIDGKVVSIWDVQAEGGYQVVADALSALVKSSEISNVFLHTERTAGANRSFESFVNGGIATWEHFFVHILGKHFCSKGMIDSKLGEHRSTFDLMYRALNSITEDALETVMELITQNTLYRGAEHLHNVREFYNLKCAYLDAEQYAEQDSVDVKLFVWERVLTANSAVARIRNSVIGTLLVDLSENVPLEDAVKKYEVKVAPANYKRPTALVTASMIKKAKETLEELGLVSALERRYATINDITVNNILFADRSVKHLSTDVFDSMLNEAGNKAPKSLSKVDEVTIDQFIEHILPSAKKVEVMIDNAHQGNLVSLITAKNSTAPDLFKWPNKFSWSYNGGFADSIKERVKQAGGNVTGDVCCRLAWEYKDDLDFHMQEPGSRRINYASYRGSKSPNGGMLDVDANGVNGMMEHPVENIFYEKIKTMRSGIYTLRVNNFNKRSQGVGFEVEIEVLGKIYHLVYDKAVPQGGYIAVAEIAVTKIDGKTDVMIKPLIEASVSSRDAWGIPTNTFQEVSSIMLSPNFWDDYKVGNKHYFFMINGCINKDKARGFLNEFLKPDLDQHRKVLEMVGSKMSTEESDRQLSGLGFSSTQRNSLICRISGSFTRVVKILF